MRTDTKAVAARAKALPQHVEHLSVLITELARFAHPADMVVSRYFRAQPKLGNRDRALIAEASFAFLRRKTEISQFAESGKGPLGRRLALLSLFITLIESGLGTGNRAESALADLAFVVHPDEIEWLQRFGAIERDSLATLTRVNLPQWIWESLPHSVPQDQCLSLAEAMLKPAPLDLRVNTIKTQREDLMAVLGDLGGRYTPEPTPFAPHGIRLRGKPALQTQEFFKKGAAEVQDEGSQLLSMLLAPKRGEMVVDFCAGAGGKTLSLGAMMRSSGRLYAFDVSEKRLANLKPRLAKSGLSNVHPVWIDNENDIKVKRLAGKIDRVLVDAPCSGLGTLRRNPDLKWRQSPQSVAELTQKQLSILTSAARLLKPGGRLVYATCSLIYEENQGVVENFLKANPNYELKDPKEVLSGSFPMVDGLPVGSSQNSKWWQLFPHIHATDAFFGAVLEKKA
jgi:16S rRNA (cytosine967-C5)-methyltransferase